MKMFASLKKKWRTFRADPPGKRFQERHRRNRASQPAAAVRIAMFLCGLILLLVGIFFMLVPGPGIPIAAVGAAMIANESLLAARALDALEVALRKAWRAVRPRKKQ